MFISRLYAKPVTPPRRSSIAVLLALCFAITYARPSFGYYEDVHFILTKFLAEELGILPSQADLIARYDQAVDNDPSTRPWPPPANIFYLPHFCWTLKNFHFVTGPRLNFLGNLACGNCDMKTVGQYLHAAEDSKSHMGYAACFGHLWASVFGPEPDKTSNASREALDMALSKLWRLKELVERCWPEEKIKEIFSSKLEDRLERFFGSSSDNVGPSKLKLLVGMNWKTYIAAWEEYLQWKKENGW